MNRPTDKQLEDFFARTANADDVKMIIDWLKTEEGFKYLDRAISEDYAHFHPEIAEVLVDHDIPSEAIYEKIQNRIRRKRQWKIGLRIAAVLIPILILVGLYFQVNSRVDIFGGSPNEIVKVAKGERLQLMFQDGSRVYINSDTELRYPRQFGLTSREIFLQGEAYFEVAKNAHRPFIVHLGGPDIRVIGTSFNVKNYADEKEILVYLEKGKISMTLSASEQYDLHPGEMLVYDKSSKKCTITSMKKEVMPSMSKNHSIVYDDTPLSDVLKDLARRYNVRFIIKDASALRYVYTLSSGNIQLDKLLLELQKITPVRFKYQEQKKEVLVFLAK